MKGRKLPTLRKVRYRRGKILEQMASANERDTAKLMTQLAVCHKKKRDELKVLGFGFSMPCLRYCDHSMQYMNPTSTPSSNLSFLPLSLSLPPPTSERTKINQK